MRTLIPLAVETLHRKATRSLRQRGVLRTVQRCFLYPWNMLRNSLRSALPSEQRFQEEEREFDRRHNISTCRQWDPTWMARIGSPNWKHGIGYAPVPAEVAMKIFAGLNIPYEQFAFVDYGAGKGRAVFVAAGFPFKRIIGVEYSPALVEAMQANISRYRNANQQCFEIEGLLQDATKYELPRENVVMFLHHPFDAVVFRQVLARIEQSLADYPRTMLIIYYDPFCENVLESSPYFRLRQRGTASGRSAACGDWVIYESF